MSRDILAWPVGWFVDLVVIGLVYGILIVLRTQIVWLNIRCRMTVSIVTLGLTGITMLFFALIGILGNE